MFSARRVPDRTHHRMVRCRRCSLVRADPVLDPDLSAELYRASTFDYAEELDGLRATYGTALDRLAALAPARRGILDIGCGNGFMLELARERGWTDVRGVEPSADAIAQARLDVRELIVPDIMRRGLFPDESFDAVTLFQVLDHMPDPRTLLRDCRTVLRPGGCDPGPQPQRCRMVGSRTRRAQSDRRRRAHLPLFARDDPAAVRTGGLRGHERGLGQEHPFACLPAPSRPDAAESQSVAVAPSAGDAARPTPDDDSIGKPLPDRAPTPMKALVTGADGFIGSNLVRHLLRAGHETVAILRPESPPWRLVGILDEVAVDLVDLRDPDAASSAVLRARPDVIFHLAAHGAYSWQKDFDAMLAVNVRATEALLEAARSTGSRLVNAGTSSEYGIKDHAPSEAECVDPNSLYAVTKVSATHLCRLAAATHAQHAVTLRLYSVYGLWEEPGRLMPTLVERAIAGRLPPLVDPEIARDFIWVEDACEAFVLAASVDLADPGAVLNIASGVQSTLQSVVEVVRSVFEIKTEPSWGTMQQREWDTSVWVGAPAAAHEALGWRARTRLPDGLRQLAEWLRSNPGIAARYAPAGTS